MAIGKRQVEKQEDLWITWDEIPQSPGHPFYEHLNGLLSKHKFDAICQEKCKSYYAEKKGRPGLPPENYFRLLLIGFFEGLDSERGIAWRCKDSLSLRAFLGYGLTDAVPDHSTLSRTRRLIDLETHQEVFQKILEILGKEKCIQGKTLGVDATTLEANAAMKSIIRRDTGGAYDRFLEQLAKESGIATPTREDLAKFDRQRKKKGSNDDWFNPHDPDAKITKMKDGNTHLAYKAEHAVDMKTGVVVAATIQPANEGDTTTMWTTLQECLENVEVALPESDKDSKLEVVADKGYHSNESMLTLKKAEIRSYVSEPSRGRRNWEGKQEEQMAVYANRYRVRGKRGKSLQRKRGEMVERTFAHGLETGGMRRVYLRGFVNVAKRYLIHIGGLNLGVMMRTKYKLGTPRGWGLGSGQFNMSAKAYQNPVISIMDSLEVLMGIIESKIVGWFHPFVCYKTKLTFHGQPS